MGNPDPLEKKLRSFQSDLNAGRGEMCSGPCKKKMKKGDPVYRLTNEHGFYTYICRKCAVAHVKEGEHVCA